MATNNPYCLQFDGTDDLIDNMTIPENIYCIELKFYVGQDYTGDDARNWVFSFGSGNLSLGAFTSSLSGETVYFSDGSGGAVASDDTILSGWHHLAIAWNGLNYDLILDGSYMNLIEDNASTLVSGNLLIGKRDGSAEYFVGKIDEMRFWNQKRSLTQITKYSDIKLAGDEEGLVHYYRFDSGSGTTLVDSSGSVDGSITGATWIAGEVDLRTLISISGDVTLDGSAVENAKVFLINTTTELLEKKCITDTNGLYQCDDLHPDDVYHAIVEYEDANGKYNAESLPFLNS